MKDKHGSKDHHKKKHHKRRDDEDRREDHRGPGGGGAAKVSDYLPPPAENLPLVQADRALETSYGSGSEEGAAQLQPNAARDSTTAMQILFFFLGFGFFFGLLAARLYYRQRISRQEERYRVLMAMHNRQMASGGLAFLWNNLGVAMVVLVLPVAAFGAFLYRRHLLHKGKEKERRMSARIRASAGAAVVALGLGGWAFARFNRREEPAPGNPLLEFWGSIGSELKAVLGVCAFLAFYRMFPNHSEPPGGGPARFARRSGSRHHHRHSHGRHRRVPHRRHRHEM